MDLVGILSNTYSLCSLWNDPEINVKTTKIYSMNIKHNY